MSIHKSINWCNKEKKIINKLGFYVLLAWVLTFSTHAFSVDPHTIRLITTTSVENSGLLNHLLPLFTEQHPYQFNITATGTGKALRLGRTRSADVIIVHAPESEKEFVNEGFGIMHHTIMKNNFVIIGPQKDPASVAITTTAPEAFTQIAKTKSPFISRADDSGTNKKELYLWELAGIDPYGEEWYIETGMGMSASLSLTEENKAYMLIDKATYIVKSKNILSILQEDPVNLDNRYGVIVINPEKHTDVNISGAVEFAKWLISKSGQSAIESFTHNELSLFTPTLLTMNTTRKYHITDFIMHRK